MLQPRRIGQQETAEWHELYRFYLQLERSQRREGLRKALISVTVACVPLAISAVAFIR